jgi:hypothetical protein
MLTRASSGSLAGVRRSHITPDVPDIIREDRKAKKRKEDEKEAKRVQKNKPLHQHTWINLEVSK